jgi:hypothetical protein
LIACACAIGAQAEPAKISWVDLIDPSAQSYEDPFLDLSFDQLSALRDVARARMELEDESLPTENRSDIEQKLADVEAALSKDGVDADWLLEQRWVVAERRERAFTAGNPDVEGQIVRLSGFAIPAPPDPDGTAVAYLVPERGMCSHTPPPNPNQMVRVRLTDDWKPRMMHEPVHLTGVLSIAPTEQTMIVVDGPVPMRATFLMNVSNVEPVSSFGTTSRKESMSYLKRIQAGQNHTQIASPNTNLSMEQ